jgi:iron complex outermembrane receptor protein
LDFLIVCIMGKSLPILVVIIALAATLKAQEIIRDTTLQEVVVQAYTSGKPLQEVPASIGYLSGNELTRYSNASIVPAVNSVPGVRMEERSPGSYRFSIRGSLLRSPFGVRNVKFYWNGLPLTDGGGNTYLNLIDFNSIGSMEIIKGPGGSLYGANTGGVVLLNSPVVKTDAIHLSALAGSFGLLRYQAAWEMKNEYVNARVQYAHQQSNGYREQTRMVKDALNADVTVLLNAKSTLSTTFFYTDLFYETPGGLTLTQYQANPRQARPGSAVAAGAEAQQAAVHNQSPYAGLSYEYDVSERWSTRIGVFVSNADFRNPTIRNYEKRKELNLGARMENHYRFGKALKNKITFGAESQAFRSPVKVFDNNGGIAGNVQIDDKLSSRVLLLFGQADLELPAGINLTAGGSVNMLTYDFDRRYPEQVSHQKKFNSVISPRIALLKKFNQHLSVFANTSKGFSPPSLAEVRPSTNTYNADLQAETGTNYELGFRGKLFGGKLSADMTVYDFSLNHTIVPRHQADGAEYFINAGKTRQNGIECSVSVTLLNNPKGVISNVKIWNSYTYNHYRFSDYHTDVNDLSGNSLTGIPPVVNVTGLDIALAGTFYLNATANYTDHIPLTDDNSTYANEYFLLGARAGYKTNITTGLLEFYTGIDNALDRTYSLGNDLNAAAGRFYNAAAGRNFYFGASFKIPYK